MISDGFLSLNAPQRGLASAFGIRVGGGTQDGSSELECTLERFVLVGLLEESNDVGQSEFDLPSVPRTTSDVKE